MNFNNSGSHDVNLGINSTDYIHEIECKNGSLSLQGPQFIILDSVIKFCNVDKEVEINVSIHKNLMLVNWKETSDEANDTCSIALDISPFWHGM